MLRGTCSPHAPSEPRIYAADSSFSPQNQTAWTTPCADDTGLRKKRYAQGGIPLSLQVRDYCLNVLGYEPCGQNPDFRDALMGFPPSGTCASGRVETESFRAWLDTHSLRYSDG
jgi:hypothetical protein